MLLESQLFAFMDAEMQYMEHIGKTDNDRYQFNKWKKSVAKTVDIVSYKSLPIAEDIDEQIENHILTIRTKQCYDNSFWTAFSNGSKGVRFCEGIGGTSVMPIDHAWNSFNGQDFDLTAEIAIKGWFQSQGKQDASPFTEYLKIIELTPDDVEEFSSKLHYSGPFTLAYFYKYVKKEWNKKTIKMLKQVLSSMD